MKPLKTEFCEWPLHNADGQVREQVSRLVTWPVAVSRCSTVVKD